MKKYLCHFGAIFIFSALLFFPHLSHAASSINPLDNVLSNFQDAIINGTQFQNTLQKFAENLFFGLITIALIWRMFPLILKGATLEEFIHEILMYIISTGFFLWLMKNGFQIGLSILKSLEKLAGLSVGNESLNPSAILAIGFSAFYKVTSVITPWNALTHSTDILLYTLFATAFLILLTLISITLMLAFIKAYMVIYAGMVVLGFGAATWYREMVINYFKSALNYGVRIFTLITCVSICTNVLNNYIARLETINISILVELLVLSLITYMMSNKLPEVVSGLIGATFSSQSSFGHMAQTVAAPIETAAKIAKVASPQTATLMAAEKMAQGASSISGGGSVNPPPSMPSTMTPPKAP